MKKKIWKRIVLVLGIFLLSFLIINLIGVPIAYDVVFKHRATIDFNETPGVVNYTEYQDQYKRSDVTYQVQGHNMAGYSYLENTTDYLIVSVHGFRDYADYLMREDFFFVDHGYNVFSFDLSGCGNSEGYTNGFSQSLIDLEGTLSFLNTDYRFKDYKKLLFGFSAGGYASLSVLSLTDENILGSCAISSYYDAENLVYEKGFEYVNFLAFFGKPLVWIKEKRLFDDYLTIRATDAICNSNVPVFLAHGTKDTVITYNKLDTYSKIEESDRVFKYSKEATHSGILYSDRALEYQKEVKATLGKLKGKEKEKYFNQIDDMLYSELNEELFERVLQFFEYCIS